MAQLRFFVISLVLGATAVPWITAHSSGAPTAACSTMKPEHQPSTETPGANNLYALQAPKRVAAGSTTAVIIRGSSFKGFLVRVMDASGSEGGSKFVDHGPGARYQALDCDAVADSATHTDGTDKEEIKLEWQAPTVPGTYRIMATIVQDYSKYYTQYFTDVHVV